MRCLFSSCFRIKQSQIASPPPEPVVVHQSKNALSSLFVCDDESIRTEEEGRGVVHEEIVDLNEAKFGETSGTIPESPLEIRKAPEEKEDISAENIEEKSLRLNAGLGNASTEKLKPEILSYESITPVIICEESTTGEGSLEETLSSCMTDGQNTRRQCTSSTTNSDMQNVITPIDPCDSENCSATSSEFFALSVKGKNKSVDCESGGSAFSSKGSTSESATQHFKQSGPACSSTASNSVENPSQLKESKNEVFDSDHSLESLSKNGEVPLMPTPNSVKTIEELSVEEQVKYHASQSSWIKPPSANQDGSSDHLSLVSDENFHCGSTPGDRPILGMVAAHWNDDHISSVMWDGNGIPNSTNKYKEDQKVSWHATPFEERLEKALSEESFISRRRPVIGTQRVEFDGTEESDTALSQLQSSDHYKSVVSF